MKDFDAKKLAELGRDMISAELEVLEAKRDIAAAKVHQFRERHGIHARAGQPPGTTEFVDPEKEAQAKKIEEGFRLFGESGHRFILGDETHKWPVPPNCLEAFKEGSALKSR